MKKIRNILTLALSALFLGGFLLAAILTPDKTDSLSERRKLAQRPALRASAVADGTYMTAFEKYTLDQFPLRDGFRALKAFFSGDILRQLDNNGVYAAEGHLAKLDYPVNPDLVRHAAERFSAVYETYFAASGANVYYTVVPDKNYFLAEQNGYPAMDYELLTDTLRAGMPYAEYIDIFGTLSLDKYYRTDAHWRQETLMPTAEKIAAALGADIEASYTPRLLDKPFRGVYSGKTDLSLDSEPLYYLDSAVLSACRVYDYETEKYLPVYDLEKASGRDAYELFLSGSKSLLRIENPNSSGDRRLIIFRDSFGSSLAPLLVPAYAEVTLVDIRYIASARLGSLIDFDNADVLFLYSAGVLNNSETMK